MQSDPFHELNGRRSNPLKIWGFQQIDGESDTDEWSYTDHIDSLKRKKDVHIVLQHNLIFLDHIQYQSYSLQTASNRIAEPFSGIGAEKNSNEAGKSNYTDGGNSFGGTISKDILSFLAALSN